LVKFDWTRPTWNQAQLLKNPGQHHHKPAGGGGEKTLDSLQAQIEIYEKEKER